MDWVPAALDLLWVPVTSLLDKNNSCKWRYISLTTVQCILCYWPMLSVRSVYLQNHGQGPTGKQRRPLPQNTFLCTGRMQCWHQSPASSVSRLASPRRPGLAHTGCSKETSNNTMSRGKGRKYECDAFWPITFEHHGMHKRNRKAHTCMSLRLYCSHREGSPSQPWKKK